MYIYTLLFRITETMAFQNIDLSSCVIYIYQRRETGDRVYWGVPRKINSPGIRLLSPHKQGNWESVSRVGYVTT
jgi:hypothetical protein